MNTSEKIYRKGYRIEQGVFTKKELIEKNLNGCDQLIIHSIILPEDGSYSHLLVSCDENGEELTGTELFKAWVLMAKTIADNPTTSQAKRELAQTVFQIVADSMKKIRENEG